MYVPSCSFTPTFFPAGPGIRTKDLPVPILLHHTIPLLIILSQQRSRSFWHAVSTSIPCHAFFFFFFLVIILARIRKTAALRSNYYHVTHVSVLLSYTKEITSHFISIHNKEAICWALSNTGINLHVNVYQCWTLNRFCHSWEMKPLFISHLQHPLTSVCMFYQSELLKHNLLHRRTSHCASTPAYLP